jgi:hypothetical protein
MAEERPVRGGRARALGFVLGLCLLVGARHACRGSIEDCRTPVVDGKDTARVHCGVIGATSSIAAPLGVARLFGLHVDLDQLTQDDFESLPGIGKKLASRIVEARKKSGGFKSVEELGEVKGIGPVRLATIRNALDQNKH